MTEQEWLECTDPRRMLEFLSDASPRKRSLFAVACCRRIWHLLKDERSRILVEKVERHADGLVSHSEVYDAYNIHENAEPTYDYKAPWFAVMWAASPFHCMQTADDAAEAAGCAVWWESIPEDDPIISLVDSAGRHTEMDAQCRILRDIFGNPFRPVAFVPSWLTPTVVKLAQSIYDDRNFGGLPILGDALEEGGCTNAEVLNHCRGPGPHVRGCWALDLLLGKE